MSRSGSRGGAVRQDDVRAEAARVAPGEVGSVAEERLGVAGTETEHVVDDLDLKADLVAGRVGAVIVRIIVREFDGVTVGPFLAEELDRQREVVVAGVRNGIVVVLPVVAQRVLPDGAFGLVRGDHADAEVVFDIIARLVVVEVEEEFRTVVFPVGRGDREGLVVVVYFAVEVEVGVVPRHGHLAGGEVKALRGRDAELLDGVERAVAVFEHAVDGGRELRSLNGEAIRAVVRVDSAFRVSRGRSQSETDAEGENKNCQDNAFHVVFLSLC